MSPSEKTTLAVWGTKDCDFLTLAQRYPLSHFTFDCCQSNLCNGPKKSLFKKFLNFFFDKWTKKKQSQVLVFSMYMYNNYALHVRIYRFSHVARIVVSLLNIVKHSTIKSYKNMSMKWYKITCLSRGSVKLTLRSAKQQWNMFDWSDAGDT